MLLLLLIALGIGAHAKSNIAGCVAETAPTIDGDISDACWQTAPCVSDFYFTPKGTPAEETTLVRVCYDQKNIYLAFHCKDSQPDKVKTQLKKRGGYLDVDDNVWVVINPYANDNRTAWFGSTAAGVQDEHIPWNTVSKIEWRGDWNSAARRVPDGYTVEMAIPFAILQYGKDQTTMRLMFERNHPRLAKYWRAPDVGPSHDVERYYVWEGLRLPRPNLRPMMMGYSLLRTGGDVSAHRTGLDIKHAFTPSLTGLIAVNPYFDDVEQQVAGTDFTYNERYLPDSRPFFQEGQGFFPPENILYTRRIEQLDAGVKVYGKAAGYSLAFMHAREFSERDYTLLQVGREFGNMGDFWLCGFQSNGPGVENFVRHVSTRRLLYNRNDRKTEAYAYIITAHAPSGTGSGSNFDTGIYSNGPPKTLAWSLTHQRIDSDYDPYLAYVPEKDLRRWSADLSTYDKPANGAINYWGASMWADEVDHLDSSLYHKSIGLQTSCQWRNGSGGGLALKATNRPPYRDRTAHVYYWWGLFDLYRDGYADLTVGRQAGGSYFSYTIGKGWTIAEGLNLYTSYENSRIKQPSPEAYSASQLTATLAYDLDTERTLAGRMIAQRGKQNFYLAYRQRVRRGMDAYVIFGDPNAESTKSALTFKLMRLL